MTAVYTHTRPQTRRDQLETAMQARPAIAVAEAWLQKKKASLPSPLVNDSCSERENARTRIRDMIM
jgi:hypothetical protein